MPFFVRYSIQLGSSYGMHLPLTRTAAAKGNRGEQIRLRLINCKDPLLNVI
ncbi:hypothetical protein [Cellvibrio sp.]|uniref:hypothetical protein n=1 Tax=Cellvibrio sp. TaxID=1965322 RepID=UPI0039647B8A